MRSVLRFMVLSSTRAAACDHDRGRSPAAGPDASETLRVHPPARAAGVAPCLEKLAGAIDDDSCRTIEMQPEQITPVRWYEGSIARRRRDLDSDSRALG